jgi:hypothetical protein
MRMLSSIRASRRCILAWVKFRSLVLTALNLLPSVATLASLNISRRRHTKADVRRPLQVYGFTPWFHPLTANSCCHYWIGFALFDKGRSVHHSGHLTL